MEFQCFPFVKTVVEAADKRFGTQYTLVLDNLTMLKEYCTEIDRLILEFDCSEFSCSIDETSMKFILAVRVEDISSCDPNSSFQRLLSVAEAVSVSNHGGENLDISFWFPPLWQKVY